jgi:hypothetical protein
MAEAETNLSRFLDAVYLSFREESVLGRRKVQASDVVDDIDKGNQYVRVALMQAQAPHSQRRFWR